MPGAGWRAFEASLDGTLLRRGAPGFALAHQLYQPRFDGLVPKAVVRCASVADVQRAVGFALSHGIEVTARSGGHSYAGYSTSGGIVVDLRRLSRITFDASTQQAGVGGGALTIDVAAALARRGAAVPTGTCASVGIGGLALGGGQGVIARKFGLTCDAVTSVETVTGDASIRRCDTQQETELFWAARGAGGGNFGIVTGFTFQTHPLAELTLFSLSWPWAAAVDVMTAWQGWGPDAPDELWSDCHLLSRAPQGLSVSVNGAFVGPQAALQPLLNVLQSDVGGAPPASSVRTVPYLDAVLSEAGCIGWDAAECRVPSPGGAGRLPRQDSYAKSDLFGASLSPAAIGESVAAVQVRAADAVLAASTGGLAFDAWGGQINRPAPSDTAFVHRQGRFLAQYVAEVQTGAPAAVVAKNRSWLSDTYAVLHPSANGFAYQNYIDPDLPDWLHAYYGSNLDRLRRAAATYDPNEVFRFAQSIPPRF